MKLALIALLCSASVLHAAGTVWSLDKKEDMSFWRSFGTVDGKILGPSEGDYAVSGIGSNEPVVKGPGTEVAVDIVGFKVTQPAPEDAENGNDLRLNVVLSPKSNDAYNNDAAVFALVLSYNSRNGGIYASLQSKEAKKPNASTTQIVGEYLGNDFSAIDVAVKVKSDAIEVDFKKGGSLLKQLSTTKSAALTEMLKSKLYVLIYQQNIHVSQGTVSVKEVSSTATSKP